MFLWQFLKTEFRDPIEQIGNDNEEYDGRTSSTGTRAPNQTTRFVFRSTTPLSPDRRVPILKLRKVPCRAQLEQKLTDALAKYNLDLDIDSPDLDLQSGAAWCQAASKMSGRPMKNETDQQAHTALGSGLASTLIADKGHFDVESEYKFHLLTPYHPNLFGRSHEKQLFETAFERSLKAQFGQSIPKTCKKGQQVPSVSSGEPGHLALYRSFRSGLWEGYQGRLLKGAVPLPFGTYEGVFGVEEKTEAALSSCLSELEEWWQSQDETLDLLMIKEPKAAKEKNKEKKEKEEAFVLVDGQRKYSTKLANMMSQIWEEMIAYRYGVTIVTCRSKSFLAFMSDRGEMSISHTFEHHWDPAIHHHPHQNFHQLTLRQKVDVIWYRPSLLTLVLAVAVWAKNREIELRGTELKGWPESWPPARDV
ncbi:hypothetical protein I204_05604 [Kwoniella mangroviensis CBS 8886]|nr:hypothetical protein I204_05604 [Kwoniella mangroviensis CBS 8886]